MSNFRVWGLGCRGTWPPRSSGIPDNSVVPRNFGIPGNFGVPNSYRSPPEAVVWRGFGRLLSVQGSGFRVLGLGCGVEG